MRFPPEQLGREVLAELGGEQALDGGEDGLAAYRAIADDALRLLTSRGRLVTELGQGQAEPVSAIMCAAGLTIETPIRRDLAGINRALCATAP